MSAPRDLERRFLDIIHHWLVSLPHDLRVLFEAKDDPNLERPARELAAGAIIFVLSPDGSSQDAFVEYADDAILVRQVLRRIVDLGGEDASTFTDRFPDYYEPLDADLKVCKDLLGDAYDWLAAKIDGLGKQVYKGKKVGTYLDSDEDAELLYEDGLEFQTDYTVDDESLDMRLKKADTIVEPLRRKAGVGK